LILFSKIWENQFTNESELKLGGPTPNGISTRKALHDTDLKRKLPRIKD
jgi:hypothetical protein